MTSAAYSYQLLADWPEEAAPPIYSWLSGGRFVGGISTSPDPLHGYRWGERWVRTAEEPLQCYALLPVGEDHCGGVSPLGSLKEVGAEVRVEGCGELRVDFGVESAAWVEFESDDLCGEVEVSISESNRPAVVNEGAECRYKTARPIREGRTWRLQLNKNYYEGVRFAWIHVRDCPRAWSFRNLRLVCQVKPANYEGTFSCGDAELTKIWHVGAYSVRLNFLKDHLGAILMERSDRHSWTGDAMLSQAVSLPVFSNYAFVRSNIVRMEIDTNGIETYSLYWILAALDDFWFSGDTGYLRSKLPLIREKLFRAASVHLEQLPLVFCGHDDRIGSCFDSPETSQNRLLFHALAVRTARGVAAALAMLGGCAQTEKVCRQVTELVGSGHASGIHCGTEALLAGILPDPEAFAARFYSNPVSRISLSPFNGYFLLEGMAACARYQEALDAIRRGWDTMLELGATTFWEAFRPEWKSFLRANDTPPNGTHGYTSLCHPWSSGPTRWLSEHALGIRPVRPGFSEFQFRPNPCGLPALQGVVPTPHGAIAVDCDESQLRLEVPENTLARLPDGRALPPGSHRLPIKGAIKSRRQQIGISLPVYPVKWLAESALVKIHKSFGWIAFEASQKGGDRDCLPAGIRVETRGSNVHWVPERVYFGPGNEPFFTSTVGGCGGLRTCNPAAALQSYALDVQMDSAYFVGLIFLDYEDEGIRQTVDLLDGESFELIAPTRLVDAFQTGRVLWFQYDRPFRIRLSNFGNTDALLNGLIFSKCSP